jgi:hypothetical protein
LAADMLFTGGLFMVTTAMPSRTEYASLMLCELLRKERKF